MGTATYRVPILSDDPTLSRLANRSRKPRNKDDPKFSDMDEPAMIICGVENPFAGVAEEDDTTLV